MIKLNKGQLSVRPVFLSGVMTGATFFLGPFGIASAMISVLGAVMATKQQKRADAYICLGLSILAFLLALRNILIWYALKDFTF